MIGCSAIIAESLSRIFTLEDKYVTLKIKKNRVAVETANKCRCYSKLLWDLGKYLPIHLYIEM